MLYASRACVSRVLSLRAAAAAANTFVQHNTCSYGSQHEHIKSIQKVAPSHSLFLKIF